PPVTATQACQVPAAPPTGGTGSGTTPGPFPGIPDGFPGLLRALYLIMFPLSLVLGAFFIIRAGYGIATSEGNPQTKKTHVEDLTASIAGTVFILLSMTLLRVIIGALIGNPNF